MGATGAPPPYEHGKDFLMPCGIGLREIELFMQGYSMKKALLCKKKTGFPPNVGQF